MQAAIRIAMTTERPCPFWKGWLLMLLLGTVVGAYVGLLVLQSVGAALWGMDISFKEIPLRAFGYMPTAIVFCFFAGFIPISISYALVRRFIPRAMATAWGRFGIGLAVGSLWNVALLVVYPPHDLQNPAHPVDRSIRGLTSFPYAEIEVAAPIILLLSRRQWFGIA
jgi:hypothetical protein